MKPTLQTQLYFRIDGKGEGFPRLEWFWFSCLLTFKKKKKGKLQKSVNSLVILWQVQNEQCHMCLPMSGYRGGVKWSWKSLPSQTILRFCLLRLIVKPSVSNKNNISISIFIMKIIREAGVTNFFHMKLLLIVFFWGNLTEITWL